MLPLLFFACSAESVTPPPVVGAPAAPAPSVVPSVPTPPSASEALRPPPRSPGGQLVRIEAMQRRCEVSCDRLLSSARSSEKPVESREILWWALSAADVPDAVRVEISSAAVDIAAAPMPLWRPMAVSLAHDEPGRQVLSGLMTTAEEVVLRAAAACALLSERSAESWHDAGLDVATISEMGTCATPWDREQPADTPSE
ncbi:MAG: hypothetical protein P8R54_12490 [Myxococcota bacterium]|nr:hypothetical protein [Myxococcota bacterium]